VRWGNIDTRREVLRLVLGTVWPLQSGPCSSIFHHPHRFWDVASSGGGVVLEVGARGIGSGREGRSSGHRNIGSGRAERRICSGRAPAARTVDPAGAPMDLKGDGMERRRRAERLCPFPSRADRDTAQTSAASGRAQQASASAGQRAYGPTTGWRVCEPACTGGPAAGRPGD
jgi:hypothetical protein